MRAVLRREAAPSANAAPRRALPTRRDFVQAANRAMHGAMPELPEVETVRRGLEPVLAGARLARVEARRPDLRFPLARGLRPAADRRAHRAAGPPRQVPAGAARPRRDAGDAPGHERPLRDRRRSADAAARRLRPRRSRRSEARPRRLRDRGRRDGHLLRPAPLRLHGPDRHRRAGRHPWFAGLGPEPLGCGFDAAHLARAFAGRRQPSRACCSTSASSPGSATSMSARRCTGPASRRSAPAGDVPRAQARRRWPSAIRDGARRGDRGRRLDLARLRRRRRRAGLFPAPVRGLWPRGRALPEAPAAAAASSASSRPAAPPSPAAAARR